LPTAAPTRSAAANRAAATTSAAPPAAKPQDSVTFGLPPAAAATIDDAPCPSPSAEQADSASLPLAAKYAPSSVPPDIRRATHFDRTA
jgi:hypothetical protein